MKTRHVLRQAGFRWEGAFRGLVEAKRSVKEYARATLEWLLRAQKATPDGGVAESYDIVTRRWNSSYPETTGYIICSVLRAADKHLKDPAVLRAAAVRMGEWLLTTQMDCGAFPGGNVAFQPKQPTVFNTGQIIKGLTDLILAGVDGDGRFRSAAARAARWLMEVQEPTGEWRQGRSPLTQGSVHSYDVRTAWALARYGKAVGDARAVEAAIGNAVWLCSVRDQQGWCPHMSFIPEEAPLTHTVAYTIQGLLEIGLLFDRTEFVEAAASAAGCLRALQDPRTGAVPGRIAAGFRPASSWSSSTGNAQMAIVWFRLAETVGGDSWRDPALHANRFDCSLQEMDMDHPDDGRRGGVRGSFPSHLGYGRYWYMNWTQKFHLDALLAQMGVPIR